MYLRSESWVEIVINQTIFVGIWFFIQGFRNSLGPTFCLNSQLLVKRIKSKKLSKPVFSHLLRKCQEGKNMHRYSLYRRRSCGLRYQRVNWRGGFFKWHLDPRKMIFKGEWNQRKRELQSFEKIFCTSDKPGIYVSNKKLFWGGKTPCFLILKSLSIYFLLPLFCKAQGDS